MVDKARPMIFPGRNEADLQTQGSARAGSWHWATMTMGLMGHFETSLDRSATRCCAHSGAPPPPAPAHPTSLLPNGSIATRSGDKLK
jgi:hypothetical protein